MKLLKELSIRLGLVSLVLVLARGIVKLPQELEWLWWQTGALLGLAFLLGFADLLLRFERKLRWPKQPKPTPPPEAIRPPER